jgi:hypothetical protein
MALSVMPDEEMKYFERTVSWIGIENPENDTIQTKSLVCLHSFTPGGHPFPWITAILLKRKEDSAMLPYMSFFVAFSNYTYQIFIPFSPKDDHIIGKRLDLKCFPNIHNDILGAGKVKYTLINMSDNNTIRGELNEMTMHYDKKTELHVE